MSEPESEDTMIAALLRERVGLVQRGLKDRVAQVDEQLKLRGYKPQRGGRVGKAAEEKTPAAPQAPAQQKTEEEQRAEPPKGRGTKPTETA